MRIQGLFSILVVMFLIPLVVQAQDNPEDDDVDSTWMENYELRSHLDDLIDNEAMDSVPRILSGLEKLSVCNDESHKVWAINKLADLCFKGFGPVKRDVAKALTYIHQGVALKSHLAMSRLATCYFFGMGVDKDQQKGLAMAKEANELSKSNAFASSLAKKKGGGMYDDLVDKMEQALAKEKK